MNFSIVHLLDVPVDNVGDVCNVHLKTKSFVAEYTLLFKVTLFNTKPRL
jgi:hypothetical protein